MCFIHDDWPRFSDVTTIKRSRVARQCIECFGAIPPGSTLKRYAFGYDGEVIVDWMCLRCVKLHEAIYEHEKAAGCSGSEAQCPIGYAYEWLREEPGRSFDGERIVMEPDEDDGAPPWGGERA
jgi:hypothetical protein